MEFKKDILTTREGDTITFDKTQNRWIKQGMYNGYEEVSKEIVVRLVSVDYGHSDLNILLSNTACKNLFGVGLKEWITQSQ